MILNLHDIMPNQVGFESTDSSAKSDYILSYDKYFDYDVLQNLIQGAIWRNFFDDLSSNSGQGMDSDFFMI